MKTYLLSITTTSYGTIEIEAEDEEKAKKKFFEEKGERCVDYADHMTESEITDIEEWNRLYSK